MSYECFKGGRKMSKLKCVIIHLLVVIMLLSTIAQTTVFAAASTYRIDEAKLRVAIPSNYTVITRNTPSSAEVFSRLGLSYSAFMNNMKTSNIYLDAVSNSYSEEIVVTCKENIISDFALLSDTVLKTMASATINEMEKLGISLIKYDIYHHSQEKFIRIYWLDSANSRYGLQYYTVRDNMAMNFTLHSYDGSITSRQETVMKTIVDSVKYDAPSPVVSEGEDTDAFVYTDSDSGVKFTVPANWVEEEFNEEREFLDAKFASTKEKGLIMLFSSQDVWSEASPIDRQGMSRSDVDNSILTKSDIAEMYNTSENNVSTYMYNGVEYYKCEAITNGEMYGLSFDITMTFLVYIENGWMYIFQFSNASSHNLYSDFESLVRSVEYPEQPTYELDVDDYYDDDSYGGNTYDADDKSNDKSLNSNATIIVASTILFISVATIVICLILGKKKKKVKAIKYCGKCGQELPIDSDFCHMCGARIEREKKL